MASDTKLSELTCEQVFGLWQSEPEVIRVFDLRSKSEFEQGHIPGAIHCRDTEIFEKIRSLKEKLAVLVVSETQKNEIASHLDHFDNFVFLKNCERWGLLDLPVASQSKHEYFLEDENQYEQKQMSQHKGATLKSEIIFQQLFEPQTSTYTYIIADKKTKEAAIIDPVLETVDRDIKLIEELGLKMRYALDTHIHADHITGAGELRKRIGLKTAVSHEAQVECVDISLEDGQELLLGDKKIKVIATPGHTNTCLSYYFEGMIFTGDALLIRTCGRTDFQQGSSEKLFHSVRSKLFQLPDETMVYPGHDYRGHTASQIGTEKKFNARLKETISVEEFKKIMSELKLDNPKKIHEAVPANLACGKPIDAQVLHPQLVDGIPEVSVEDLYAHLADAKKGKIKLIDVRRPEEFNNELAHIEGAELITLGSDLTQFLEQGDRNAEIIFICRSGGRSGTATAESIKMGYKHTINMTGGMIRWNEKKLPTVRSE